MLRNSQRVIFVSSPRKSSIQSQRGFTMVELITVMVIAGVLVAVAAANYFSTTEFESRGFYDQIMSTLRYAQKAAIAQNRYVCVAFTTSGVTLTYGTTSSCADGNLTSPAGVTPYTVTSTSVTLSGYTTPLYFDALGKPNVAESIAVSGYTTASITVEAETGYVH